MSSSTCSSKAVGQTSLATTDDDIDLPAGTATVVYGTSVRRLIHGSI